jgi:hypothetical protein
VLQQEAMYEDIAAADTLQEHESHAVIQEAGEVARGLAPTPEGDAK